MTKPSQPQPDREDYKRGIRTLVWAAIIVLSIYATALWLCTMTMRFTLASG
jgi:hypothetical protein